MVTAVGLPLFRRFLLLAAAFGALTVMTGAAHARGNTARAALQPGRLLTHVPLRTAAALPSASGNMLITYMSQNATGRPIVVSGTVAIPKGAPPPGGYPVISWAHGTSGFADICAPSDDSGDGPDHDYFAVVDPVLDDWVARGYVVVQTDYEGLGTPGGHPYMNGVSETNTVVDIVRAARQLDHAIGLDWVAIGHSQGGQAALFTAQYGQARAPELHLKGVVAIAPGGTELANTVAYIRSGGPGAALAEPFLPLLLLGAHAADPAIHPKSLLTPAAQPLLTGARRGCLAQLRAMKPVPPEKIFRKDVDVRPLTQYLRRQDPRNVVPKVPTMIAQGTADRAVAKAGTDALVRTLCKSSPVDYRVYPGKDHRGSLAASFADARDFVAKVIAGKAVSDWCSR